MSKNDKNGFNYYLSKIWFFLWKSDSIFSLIADLIILYFLIKFIILPILALIFGTKYIFVVVVSGSMQHKIYLETHYINGQTTGEHVYNVCGHSFYSISKPVNLNFTQWWNYCGNFYEKNNINKSKFEKFPFKNGLNIGDIVILRGKKPDDIKQGDVLVFIPELKKFYTEYGPVIHRVVKKWKVNRTYYFETKGDHNPAPIGNFETKIPQKNVLGVGMLRIPYIGYLKIWLYEIFMNIKEKL